MISISKAEAYPRFETEARGTRKWPIDYANEHATSIACFEHDLDF